MEASFYLIIKLFIAYEPKLYSQFAIILHVYSIYFLKV